MSPSLLLTSRPRATRINRCVCVLFAVVLSAGCQASPAPAAQAAVSQPPASQGAAPSAPLTPASAGDVDPQAAAQVTLLASPDFVVRVQASETLVRMGPRALPALGAAGEQPVNVHGAIAVSTTEPVVEAILDDAADATLEAQVRVRWPNIRRAAAEELGRRGRWASIPALIERLDDADHGVRAASASSLRRLTNNFFGYRARGQLARRKAVQARWRSWWTQQGRSSERDQERHSARIARTAR